MGYTTRFQGQFEISPPLPPERVRELREFCGEKHEEVVLGSYYCQWVPSDDGRFLRWDGDEKFYEYVEWLRWLIRNKLTGHSLNGKVHWQGEEFDDTGTIEVRDGQVTTTFRFDGADDKGDD